MKVRPRKIIWILLAFIIAALLPLLVVAKGGIYTTTKHGNTSTGVYRITTEPIGACSQCHYEHASYGGTSTGGPYNYLLFADNTNSLCYTASGAGPCHNTNGALGIYQGSAIYNQSAHANSSSMVWPGPTPPARPLGDWGKCVNCHNPHGYKDGTGLIPNMAIAREENLCFTCHDGSPAKGVQTDFSKTVHHPVVNTDPNRRGPGTRSVECDDCHNPHAAKSPAHTYSTTATSTRNQISNPLIKASGIQFNYAGLGNFAAPTSGNFTFVPSTTGATYEYQICFKCHSSYNNWQGAGGPPRGISSNGTAVNPLETDVAQEFNPNNKSGHPVVTGLDNYPNSTVISGKKGLLAAALKAPWNTSIGQQTMMCSDCHNTDAGSLAAQGPHGSAVQFMLRTPNSANWPNVTLSTFNTSWCANCHNNSAGAGHTEGGHSSYRCYVCHIVIPHGGKMSRLIADNDTMPARYAYNNILSTQNVQAFTKSATTGYSTSSCKAQCYADHQTTTPSENW